MNGIAEKLRNLERQLAAEKGDPSFFALVPSDDTPDRWDLVVSAPWITADLMQGLRFIADKLKEHLPPQELLSIARIVPLGQEHPFIKAGRKLAPDVQGPAEPVALTGTIVNGVLIPNMLVIASAKVRLPGIEAEAEATAEGGGE